MAVRGSVAIVGGDVFDDVLRFFVAVCGGGVGARMPEVVVVLVLIYHGFGYQGAAIAIH